MREVINFNDGWLFKKEGQAEWESVSLPHTWNNVDGQDGGNDYFRGTCVYKKNFTLCSNAKKVFIDFGAVNQTAEVWLNGKHLGSHKGGYSEFVFDLSEALACENELTVQVCNGISEEVYPQTADFTFFGGIYRNVSLICTDEISFLPLNAIKVTPEFNEGWTVNLKVNGMPGGCAVRWKIYDEKTVLAELEADGDTTVAVDNPELWQGLENPHMYTVQAVLLFNGKEVDKIFEKIGFRTFKVDPQKGFYLNGKPYNLRGVSRHQDRKDSGYAIGKKEHEEDIALIKEIGANSVRLAHYQHDKYFYDLCDENGLIVWAEIPFITRELPNGSGNALSQMEELVRQCYHHPSVCFWGLSNEVTFGGVTQSLIDTHRQLIDAIQDYDRTRLTAIAHVYNLPTDSDFVKIADVCGYNLYFGWYVGNVMQFKPWMDDFHSAHPDLPVGLTEYGADALVCFQSGEPAVGDYSESYQTYYHRKMLEQIDEMPYLWCSYVWNMFDFASDARAEGGDDGINHKGLVTYDRKIKKDAFYLYKARWSKEPVLHICGKRYVYRHEKSTEITVISNSEQVSLYLDGQLIGTQTGKYCFDFRVEISGRHTVKAVAGDMCDGFVLEKVDKPYSAYICGSSGNAENWLYDGNCYSVKDKVKTLAANPAARKVVEEVFAKLIAARRASGAHTGEGVNPLETMAEYSLERVFNMVKSPELLKETQERLSRIKKTES